jgi:hypothetical protein
VSLVVKHGIENHEELAHAGDERGLGVLTIGTQPHIESSDSGIAANARYRRHIQDAPNLGAGRPISRNRIVRRLSEHQQMIESAENRT